MVFAEAGSSVLVLNCDFRRPKLHEYFGVPDEARRVHATPLPNLKVVTNVLDEHEPNPARWWPYNASSSTPPAASST